MMQDGAKKRPWDLGHLVIAALVVLCLTLSGMILWRRFGPHEEIRGTSDVVTTETDQPGEPSAVSPREQAPGEEGARERPTTGEGPALLGPRDRAEPRAGRGSVGGGPEPPPDAGLRELNAPGSPTGAGTASRFPPAAGSRYARGSHQ